MSVDKTHGHVFSIQLCPGHRRAMQKVEPARAVEDFGLQGDRHARPGSSRQVLLIEYETLKTLGIPVSEVKENITTRGIELMKLKAGQRIQLGEAVQLEVTQPCEPCDRMDEIRFGLQQELKGRRGMFAKVVSGGLFAAGDSIREIN